MRLFKLAQVEDISDYDNKYDKYKTERLRSEQRSKDKLLALSQYITSENNPEFFIHFGSVDRVGINPRSSYQTPNGVYCYPLTKQIFRDFVNENLPFAQDQPYIHIISCASKLLNMKNYDQNNLDKDLLKINKMFNTDPSIIEKAFSSTKLFTPIGKLWNLTRIISSNANKWSAVLRALGYVGFYDPGTGLIHNAEPTQCVILQTSDVIRVKTLVNPNAMKFIQNTHGDKQDVRHIEKIMKTRVRDIDDYPYITTPSKIKEIFGTDKITLDDMIDQNKIRENFTIKEIQFMIGQLSENESLRILYYDCYSQNEQWDNLFAAFKYLPDIKIIPLNILIEALRSVGLDAIYQMIRSVENEGLSNAPPGARKNLALLEKVFANNAKKYKIKEVEDSIEGLVNNNEEILNLFSQDPFNLPAAQSHLLSRILNRPSLKEYVMNNKDFFERMGGPKNLSDEQRKDLFKNFIIIRNINKADIHGKGFKADNLALGIHAEGNLGDVIRDNKLLFEKLGGPVGLSLDQRSDFIKEYMKNCRLKYGMDMSINGDW